MESRSHVQRQQVISLKRYFPYSTEISVEPTFHFPRDLTAQLPVRPSLSLPASWLVDRLSQSLFAVHREISAKCLKRQSIQLWVGTSPASRSALSSSLLEFHQIKIMLEFLPTCADFVVGVYNAGQDDTSFSYTLPHRSVYGTKSSYFVLKGMWQLLLICTYSYMYLFTSRTYETIQQSATSVDKNLLRFEVR